MVSKSADNHCIFFSTNERAKPTINWSDLFIWPPTTKYLQLFVWFLWFDTQNIHNAAVGNCLERGRPGQKRLVHDLLSNSSQVSAIVLSMK